MTWHDPYGVSDHRQSGRLFNIVLKSKLCIVGPLSVVNTQMDSPYNGAARPFLMAWRHYNCVNFCVITHPQVSHICIARFQNIHQEQLISIMVKMRQETVVFENHDFGTTGFSSIKFDIEILWYHGKFRGPFLVMTSGKESLINLLS